MTLEDPARKLGFASSEEMILLIAKPDLSTPEALAKFRAWQQNDGSKAGLLAAFPELREQ